MQIVECMRENGMKTKDMEEDMKSTQTKTFMKVNSSMERLMERASIFGETLMKFTMESGLRACDMVMEYGKDSQGIIKV